MFEGRRDFPRPLTLLPGFFNPRLPLVTRSLTTFVRYNAARTKGTIAWVACEGANVWDIVEPGHYRSMLARGLEVFRPGNRL